MAKDFLIIGCKSPAGMKLEIGIQTTRKNEEGKTVTHVEKTAAYETYTIHGWNHHSYPMRVAMLKSGNAPDVPHGMNTQPYLNRGVPRAFWEQWKKEHPRSWLLRNGILFEAEDEPSAAVMVKDSEKTPAVLAPLSKSDPRISGVTEADFSKRKPEPVE